MKKSIAAIFLVLTFVLGLSVSVFATDYVLDFTAPELNDPEAYSEADGEFDLTLGKLPHAAVDTLDGVEFQFKHTGAWGLITFIEQSKYNEPGLLGYGLKLRFDNNVEVTLLQPGEHWDTPSHRYIVWTGTPYNDGNAFHTCKVAKVNGQWSIKLDDVEMLGEMNADQHQIIDSLLSGAAYIGFGAGSYDDSMVVKSAVVETPETTPEQPVDPAPATADPVLFCLAISAVAGGVMAMKKRRH